MFRYDCDTAGTQRECFQYRNSCEWRNNTCRRKTPRAMATARGGTYSENPEMDGHECEPIHKDHLDLGYVCFEPDSEDEYLEEGPCAGEYNEFTQDRFKTSEKIVVLEINGHSFCHPYDSLMEFWENVDQQAVEWVKKAGVAEVAVDGIGSEPRLNSPIWFKHIQTGMWIPAYVRRYLLDNPPAPGVATAIRLERDGIMLMGNRYGIHGMSLIHGHPPGEPILRAIGIEGVVLQDADIHTENLLHSGALFPPMLDWPLFPPNMPHLPPLPPMTPEEEEELEELDRRLEEEALMRRIEEERGSVQRSGRQRERIRREREERAPESVDELREREEREEVERRIRMRRMGNSGRWGIQGTLPPPPF